MAEPLTTLLEKEEFPWTPKATKAFEHLKEVMWLAQVLAMPNFTKQFIVNVMPQEMELVQF